MNAKFVSWEDAVKWLMNQPDKQDLVKDCYYDPSVIDAANRYWKSDEWQAIKLLIHNKSGQALDLGAGRGISSYALAKDGWNVLAIEPDPSNLVGAGAIESLAITENLPIKVTKEFGEEIKCESASFDLIFARQVLHHAKNLDQLCAEVYRVLKPNGMFLAVRDHVVSSMNDMQLFLDKHPLHNLYGGENAYTEKQYLSAMRRAGFTIKMIIKSFDSVINYAPYTEDTLKVELSSRINKLPIIGMFNITLNSKWLFKLTLVLLSMFDNRPGRLFSFVCVKTEKK
jgi:2-polyprenyl-3-methyl-5-hydroxy-6-metoxy-1,4-benzoquinol methylase